MATNGNPIAEAAEAYVERGYRVIPLNTAYNQTCSCKEGKTCSSMGKHPIRNGWEKASQLGEVARAKFWATDKPANLGIVTGPDSGIFVVDVDGETGNATMKALADEGKTLPETWTAKTGSGGWHFAFEYPEEFDIGNTASTKIGKGVDTRGKGGFIVAPPSVSGKGEYKVVRDLPVAKAPDWLLELLRPKERVAPAVEPAAPVADDSPEGRRLAGYTEGAVANEVDRLKRLHWDGDPAAYRGEPWDHTVFEVACNLIQLANAPWSGLTERAAYELVWEHAPRDPGFDAARVLAKWESADKKVDGQAAAYPPKPIGAYWVADDEPKISPEPITAEDQPTADVDPFDAAVAASVNDVPLPSPPSIEIVDFNGIPTSDDHTLDPGYVARAKAAELGPLYSSRAYVEERLTDASFWDIEEFIAQPQIDPSVENDLDPVDTWIRRSLRSGTPELLWAAVGSVLAGMDTDAPTIVLKGGGPLLALLARLLGPAVGDESEMMLFGPRVSTKEVDGPQIVLEFDDTEQIDLTPYASAIVERARRATGALVMPDAETHEELDRLTDYRAAQLHRARLGLGSRARSAGGEF